jgi:hypothetical protein
MAEDGDVCGSPMSLYKYTNYPNAAKDYLRFAEACTGQQTPKEAVQRAQKRAQRHYRT